MDLKVSPEKPGFSSSDAASDPENREISEGEDEDDDRNHKHRRRDAHPQSLEGSSYDQGLTRPYRKRNRPFENGYSCREGDIQANDSWMNHNSSSSRDFISRFDKRRSNLVSFSKAPPDLHQRYRGNQTLLGEAGPVRGRGREPFSWGIHDSRLGLLDFPSQVVQPGHVPSWNAFGLVPGLPNGGLDPLHPFGLQIRPAINPPVNIGILRQRCRDFEERGFCLRGDMCPMEHGVNRIVVDDVQSLSQFNLPVALPGSQLLGTSSAHGPIPVNNKPFYSKINKPGMSEDVYGLNGGDLGVSMAGASDLYDPDQLLWTKDDPETPSTLRALDQSTADVEFSNGQNIEPIEGHGKEPKKNATASSSVWGRIGGPKRNSEAKNEKAPNTFVHDLPLHVKESSLKQRSEYSAGNIRKPSQKALHTLFVNGIPLKDNRRETLLSHFQKFGEVIDVYIPPHSERAFVQFSKREEAEAALKAPDAVMGNRFIKLFWANRDNIPDDRIRGTSVNPRGVTTNPSPSNQLVLDEGKKDTHHASGRNAHTCVGQRPVNEHLRPMVGTGPKASPPQQKKLESFELLKELRKKQEMLDQKRNEFRRQLDKLEKQALGSNDVTVTDLTIKRLKDDTSSNNAKDETSKSSSSTDNINTEKTTYTDHAMSHKSTSNPTAPVQEHLKPSFCPPLSGIPSALNRFKLDNRPTTFGIVSPLPAGLANVAALDEHFSAYGEVSLVELEDNKDDSVSSNVSARVSFTTRPFAEKAFLHGKSWQGHKLQFMWLKSGNTEKISGGSEKKNSDSSSNTPSDVNVQPREINEPTLYQKTAPLGSDVNEHLEIEANVNSGECEKDPKST